MSHHRPNLSFYSILGTVWLSVLCTIGIVSQVEKACGQQPIESSVKATSDQIGEWIQQLESDSYASRQLAFQLLQPHAEVAIPAVERAIETAEEDAANRLIRLLSGWSAFPDDGYGRTAFASLQRIGQGGVTARSTFAQRSIQAISMTQSDRSAEYLGRLSAFVGLTTLQLFAMSNPIEYHSVLRIDDAFRGSIEDLECAKWLSEVRVVLLDGLKIDDRWLAKIVKIPNLRTLQIRHTSISIDGLKLLYSLDRLEGLEILYSPIDDASIDILGNLPLWGRLRLFGTNISPDGIARLQTLLDGSEVMFGRGGFLGIASNQTGLIIDRVTEGSGAEQAGLRAGDRILSLQGKKLNIFKDLQLGLSQYAPGDVVKIEFERNESTEPFEPPSEPVVLTVEITLGEQQP